MPAGPTNSITDVPGIRVGQAQRVGSGWLTGTTVVLPPPEGAVAGVDVRGGGPGTRETDVLDPRNLVERVHAVVLSGGSALGLAAADGVARALFEDGIGFPMGGPGEVVPIVPAAILFDLGRGGNFGNAPDAELGAAAYAAASTEVTSGTVGAGTGARAGGLKGGVGTASAVLPDGTIVGAIVAVNAIGSCVDPGSGELYAARFCLPGDLPRAEPAGHRRAGGGPGGCPRGRARLPRDHPRRDRHRRHPHQGPVLEGCRHRPRRPGSRDPARAHDVRRRHRLRAGDGFATRARAAGAARTARRRRGLRDAGGGAGDAGGRVRRRHAVVPRRVPERGRFRVRDPSRPGIAVPRTAVHPEVGRNRTGGRRQRCRRVRDHRSPTRRARPAARRAQGRCGGRTARSPRRRGGPRLRLGPRARRAEPRQAVVARGCRCPAGR